MTVDELLSDTNRVKTIVSNPEEYRNAMTRINEIITNSSDADERLRAKCLGQALNMTRALMTSETLSQRYHFGQHVFFTENVDNVTSIVEGKVIGSDAECVCVVIMEGTVHFIPRSGVHKTFMDAARSHYETSGTV